MPYYSIDHDVPLPPVKLKPPFADMVVGDSFFVPTPEREQSKTGRLLARVGMKYALQHEGVEFSTWPAFREALDADDFPFYQVYRRTQEDGPNYIRGIRVWRTA